MLSGPASRCDNGGARHAQETAVRAASPCPDRLAANARLQHPSCRRSRLQNLDDAIAGYESLYNIMPVSRETIEDQGVSEAMIPIGGSYVQLLEPLTA